MERIQTRNTLGRDASDATLDVLAQQMRTLEPLEADELAAISKFSCQNLSTSK
jgi:predicted kinase